MEDKVQWQQERLVMAMVVLLPKRVKYAWQENVVPPNADIQLSIDAVLPKFDHLLSNYLRNNRN